MQNLIQKIAARLGFIPAPAYGPETIAENAACLWESVLEADPAAHGPDTPATQWPYNMRRAAAVAGMAELRARVTALAEDAESGFRLAQSAGFDLPFDWEFCPAFVARCIDWETGGLVPDWRDICRDIGGGASA